VSEDRHAADRYPVRWAGGQAVMTLPGHLDESNADQIRQTLLSVIDRGARTLIVDMTATGSCDQTGADAVLGAYQRAVATGTEMRLVATSPAVWRRLSADGLDRLMPIYSSLETATSVPAAGLPPASPAGGAAAPSANGHGHHEQATAAIPAHGPAVDAIAPSVLRALIDALTDGIALVGEDGVIELANRRLAEMFGYPPRKLVGRPVESLIPADLRAAHRHMRAGYAEAPVARPMAARSRLVGLRKDSGTVPVEISLSPVPTATGQFILAVVRDVSQARRRDDLMDLARAVADEQLHHSQELLNRIVSDLFAVGLSLETALHQPVDTARQGIGEALHRLDGTIHDIRDYLFRRQ
jgi:anti-anti-sigma factor